MTVSYTHLDVYKRQPLHHLLFNFLTKPDFIAYDCTCADAVSRRICRNLYKNLAVAWTIRSKEDMEQFKASVNFMCQVGYENISNKIYPNVRHEILNDLSKNEVRSDMLAFIEQAIQK